MVNIASKFPPAKIKNSIRLIGDISFNDIPLMALMGEEGAKLPEGLQEALALNSKLIEIFVLDIESFSITYHRGGNKQSPVYDSITINNNNSALKEKAKLHIISTLIKDLKAFDPSKEPAGLISEEQQKQLDIHLSAIKELENLNSELTQKITKDIYQKKPGVRERVSHKT